MIKKILPFIIIIGLMGCRTNSVVVDYFGQTEPATRPVLFAEGLISQKGRLEHGISFTPDNREILFGILKEDGINGAIYYAKKVKAEWTQPAIFKPLEKESVYLPYFTPNGKSLLYAQSNPDTNNGTTDIWRMEKKNGNWGTATKIPSPLSATSREANACMTYDGTIYFSSNRNCAGKEDCYTADLFYSKLVNKEYQSVQAIAELMSSNDEESVFIAPKEDYILFCRYKDEATWMDLYISYRDYDKKWTPAQRLDATINSKDWDRRPFVSIDNKFLFFTRLQIDEKGLKESDIYWVKTTKVFKPFVYHPLADMQLQVGEQFEIPIPLDYFKDIDDTQLTISCNENDFDWLEYDRGKRMVSGVPTLDGDFELIFSAVDKFSNVTADKIKITVKK